MPLSDPKCRNTKALPKPQKLFDGEGLFLLVQPNGSKLWRMAYRYGGKQKTLAFGIYPHVSLSDARERRAEAKRLLAAGKDPGVGETPLETFASVAERWFEKEKEHCAESHTSRVISRVRREAFPTLGNRPIAEIEPPEILAVLRKVEARGAIEVAKRLRQSISSIFRFAIAEGHAKFNAAADVGEALKPSPRVRHFSMVKTGEMHDLVRDVKAYDGEPSTRIGLLFAMHVFVRTGELRFATWKEIEDLDGAEPLWRIPKERMKMGREHLVPLSRQAVALLREMNLGTQYIFPGLRGKPMSENTLLYGLYRLGYHSRQTVHGFRRLASTTLNEAGFNPDHIEMQLAHVEKNRVRGAYNAAEWLPARREMMQWWSDYLDKPVG